MPARESLRTWVRTYICNYARQAAIVAKLLLLPNCGYGGGRLNVTGDCPPFYGTRKAGWFASRKPIGVYGKVIVGKWS